MIQGHLNELRSVVEQARDLPEETREKLLQLTAELERDVQRSAGALPDYYSVSIPDEDEPAPAATVTSDSSADPGNGSLSPVGESGGVSGLVSAIEGLETSHPEVTATVSNVARMLSKLGF
jgi:hypothetical protein